MKNILLFICLGAIQQGFSQKLKWVSIIKSTHNEVHTYMDASSDSRNLGSNAGSSEFDYTSHVLKYSSKSTIKFKLEGFGGCSASISATSDTICNGESVILNASGTTIGTYTWDNGLGTGPDKTVSPITTTTYTVTIDEGACTSTESITITVLQPSSSSQSASACGSYFWAANGNTYTSSGSYVYVTTNAAGCDSTITLNLVINPLPPSPGYISGALPVPCQQIGTVFGLSTFAYPSYYYVWSFVGTGGTLGNSFNSMNTLTITDTYINGVISVFMVDPLTGCTGPIIADTLLIGPFSPPPPSSFTSFTSPVCQGTSGAYYEVPFDPTISNYNWTYSGLGATLNPSANSTLIDFSANATSGNLCVTASNGSCLSNPLCAQVTVNPISTSTSNVTICDGESYTFDAQTLTTSGTYTIFGQTTNGCDSIVTLNLTVAPNTTNTQIQIACDHYFWSATGMTYFNSGSYPALLSTFNGCDSLVTLDLTIQTLPDVQTSSTATSIQLINPNLGDTYQWIDCLNGNQPITGATSSSFTATQNGQYAVVVNNANCSDTSACMIIDEIGLTDLESSSFVLGPNPTSNQLHISAGHPFDAWAISDVRGRIIAAQAISATESANIPVQSLEIGVYWIELLIGTESLGRKRFLVHHN